MSALRYLGNYFMKTISNASSSFRFRRMSSLIKSEVIDDEIQFITLNDPVRANCLSLQLLQEFELVLNSLENSSNLRLLIISGAGKFFSAGHNLQELFADSKIDAQTIFSTFENVMKAIGKLPIPSLAAVNGPAVAAGCQLVAACDLAISSQSAIYSTPGIKIGLFCSTPAVPLVRAIGLRASRELLYTGNSIDAKRAYELGLVHRVVPDEQIRESAISFAKEITQHSKSAMELGRKTLNKQVTMPIMDAYKVAGQTMLENLKLSDAQNGIKAFLSKKTLSK